MSEENSEFHSLLEQETEAKAPTENVTKMWSFDDEATIISETKTGETKTEGSIFSSEPKKPEQPKEVLTDKRKEEIRTASAETAVASLDAMIELVGSFIVNRKFKKQFSKEDFKKGKDIFDRDPDMLDDADKELQKKFKRELEIRADKLKQLPFEESDTQRLNAIFYNYFKITNKELSPEFLLYTGIGSILIDKATVIFMD